jgi:hypothetical protein
MKRLAYRFYLASDPHAHFTKVLGAMQGPSVCEIGSGCPTQVSLGT